MENYQEVKVEEYVKEGLLSGKLTPEFCSDIVF